MGSSPQSQTPAPAQGQAQTPILDKFITSISQLVAARDGVKLQDYLQIEPEWPPIYYQMVDELRRSFPKENPRSDARVLAKCERLGKGAWIAFPMFMRLYFTFLRDVDVKNLLETYNLLRALLNQCVIALGDSQSGVIVLPTALYLSKTLAKLAIGLDKQPQLIAHLLKDNGGNDPETTETVTLVEKSANVVREAFIKCLTDRTSSPRKPEGKRAGIYLMANLCLTLLFKCGKLRNAEQMFASISAHSPPLDYFPASQRVTYLYYLGRYLFSNNLFYPASIALQSAYDQCHQQAIPQKRLILTYLVSCNIIMGRFPSSALLQMPEMQGGPAEIFQPLCRIIATGNVVEFRSFLASGSRSSNWLAQKGVLLQLRNRCEVLVWRSLVRHVFILGGHHGDNLQNRSPPFLWLSTLNEAVTWMESRSPGHDRLLLADSDLRKAAVPDQINHNDGDDEDFQDYLSPASYFDASGHRTTGGKPTTTNDNDNTNNGSITTASIDPFSTMTHDEQAFQQPAPAPGEALNSPTIRQLESIISSLITQDLLHGYLMHRNPRFVIPGARKMGALPTGFPPVWKTIFSRERHDRHVPGWVRASGAQSSRSSSSSEPSSFSQASVGGGRVVNLSNVRPVGTPG